MAKSKVTVKVSPTALRDMRKLTDPEMDDFANLMADFARMEVPKDTHNLQRSLAVLRDGPLKYRVVTEGTGYGAYVELGTSRMKANPFLQRGFRRAQQKTFKGI